jgi:hypothetical protein
MAIRARGGWDHRDTLYLLRPDTYIGLIADRSCSVGTLRRYLDAREMRIGSAETPKVLAQTLS